MRLYGHSAEKSRRVLESLCIKERHVGPYGLNGFVETSDRDAFLCYGYLWLMAASLSLLNKAANTLSVGSSGAMPYYITLILRWYRSSYCYSYGRLPQAIYHPLIAHQKSGGVRTKRSTSVHQTVTAVRNSLAPRD